MFDVSFLPPFAWANLCKHPGFAAANKHHLNPSIDVIIPETQNNTLNNYCPNANGPGHQLSVWLDTFAPSIVSRLRELAPGAKVTKPDIHRLLALCPFETIALERPRPFCQLFTDKEFKAMEYYGDLEKYYKTGCVCSLSTDANLSLTLSTHQFLGNSTQLWQSPRPRARRGLHHRAHCKTDWPACL